MPAGQLVTATIDLDSARSFLLADNGRHAIQISPVPSSSGGVARKHSIDCLEYLIISALVEYLYELGVHELAAKR